MISPSAPRASTRTSSSAPHWRLFATASKGTEGLLRDELRSLGFRRIRADRGGVHFESPPDGALRACLASRIAMRILVHVGDVGARSDRDLYDGVARLDLTPFLSTRHTFAVRVAGGNDALRHSEFIAQRVKDAIVDGFRAREGARPSVNRDEPDTLFFVRVQKDGASVYADASGSPLFRRGYRRDAAQASLKETLASAMLRFAGYEGTDDLSDPLCGSGTLLIEGAWLAHDRAPGLLRQRFGMEQWPLCDDDLRAAAAGQRSALEARAREGRAHSHGLRFWGGDSDERAVRVATDNAKLANVPVRVDCQRIEDAHPEGWRGHVVANLPYGERLFQAESYPEELARCFARAEGAHVTVLTMGEAFAKAMWSVARRKPTRWLNVDNGGLDCVLLHFAARTRR